MEEQPFSLKVTLHTPTLVCVYVCVYIYNNTAIGTRKKETPSIDVIRLWPLLKHLYTCPLNFVISNPYTCTFTHKHMCTSSGYCHVAGRYWEMVERLKITHFYTAPTAIRMLIKCGENWVQKYDRSSLRILGCGE